jgi:hypothetical protein
MGNAAQDNNGDLYALLGLKRGASDGEIRDAYYRLAKEYHPDRRKADEKAAEAFRAITSAAAILRDPEMRNLYDRGESGGIALATKLKARQRSSDRRRIALVFLVSLTITTAGATKLWLVLLNRTSEVPNLVRNNPEATSSKVADASVPPEKSNRDYGRRAMPLPPIEPPSLAKGDTGAREPQPPSSAKEKASEIHAPSPTQGAISSSPPSERPADNGEKVAAPVPAAEAPSRLNEPPSQKAASFGLLDFDTSPGNGKPLSAKLSRVRDAKSKPDECSLTRAARDILMHASAALRSR